MPFSTPGIYSFGTAPPTIFELEARSRARLGRLEDDDHLRKLASAAGLLLVHIFLLNTLRQLLAISDLRRADIGVDFIGTPQNIDLDVEMQLAHALEDRLAGFLIGRNAEGRILRRELRQSDTELFLVGLRLRLDRDLDDRIGKFHPLQNHRLVLIAERVAGAGILEARERNNVAGIGFLDVFAIVGVHQQHAADALALVLGRVDHSRAQFDLARIDARESQRADKRIIHDLEGKHGERLVIAGDADHFLASVGIDALDGFAVERRWQIIDDGIEQRLHALVLERGTAEDRNERNMPHRFADESLKRRLVRLGAVEIGTHHIVIELDCRIRSDCGDSSPPALSARREFPRHDIWRRGPRLPRRRLSSARDQ